MESRSPVRLNKYDQSSLPSRAESVALLLSLSLVLCGSSIQGCATPGAKEANRAPITNPFPYDWGYEGKSNNRESVVLRTKKGDRSVEVELPGDTASFSDFTVPVSPAFTDGHALRRNQGAYSSENDSAWRDQKPTFSDREITSNFPKGPASASVRNDLEHELGVLPSEDSVPVQDTSYLAAVDHVKGMFRGGRYEAALLEVDELLRLYPTDPRLHQMRGTLLDRTGQPELAMRSWAEAIELDPSNQGLKKFVDRRRSIRAMGTRLPAAESKTFETSTASPSSSSTMPETGAKQ